MALLNLTAEYYCIWDSPGQFLAVDESAVKVYAGAKAAGEPLFRYEYTRTTTGDVPGAHVQIHGHRDALAFVMTRAGSGSPRGSNWPDGSPKAPRYLGCPTCTSR
jgi:hypothetical protein